MNLRKAIVGIPLILSCNFAQADVKTFGYCTSTIAVAVATTLSVVKYKNATKDVAGRMAALAGKKVRIGSKAWKVINKSMTRAGGLAAEGAPAVLGAAAMIYVPTLTLATLCGFNTAGAQEYVASPEQFKANHPEMVEDLTQLESELGVATTKNVMVRISQGETADQVITSYASPEDLSDLK